jgi:hypothetical protein
MSRTEIKVNGQALQAAENFTYLSSTLSRNTNIDAEIDSRIACTQGNQLVRETAREN